MKDERSAETETSERRARLGRMETLELEALAIAAIREHHASIHADDAVYRAWVGASEDSTVATSVIDALQQEYLLRQRKAEAHMEALSDMLDILGYIPDVPKD